MPITIIRKKTQAKTEPLPVQRAEPAFGVNDLATLQEIAAQLKVCKKTVRRQIRKKEVPYILVGQQIRVPRQYISLLITKQW
jgi:excisionase family DNA binding protein